MDLFLNGIFKDNMVFQRDKEIRVFGITTFEEGVQVEATLKERNTILRRGATTEIYEDGFFLIIMEALPMGGPYSLTVEATAETGDKKSIRLKNIYLGEVWLASGEANMEYPLGRIEEARKLLSERSRKGFPNIHFYEVPKFGAYTEEQFIEEQNSKWEVAVKESAYSMSAIGYLFAEKVLSYLGRKKRYQKDLHIGIIGAYVSKASISCFVSREKMEDIPEGRRYLNYYERELMYKDEEQMYAEEETFLEDEERYNEELNKLLIKNPYLTYAETAEKIGSSPIPPVTAFSLRRPGAILDTMILRLIPFSLRGVLFYQGESDADERAADYDEMLSLMIREWREIFWDEELPFIICQLPMYISRDHRYIGYDDMKWPQIRAGQMKVAKKLPNTYMAVLIDCGEFNNHYPSDKQTPATRLSSLALRFVYGYKEVSAVAPYIIDARRGEGVELSFEGDFKTLILTSSVGISESGFEIAGEDGEYFQADAAVNYDGKTVILTCYKVIEPVKVRYAGFSYGVANLVTDTGLAAMPFERSIGIGIGEYY